MPGICGIATPRSQDVAPLLNAMLMPLSIHDWHRQDEFVDRSEGVALGRVHLGIVNASPQPAKHPRREWFAFLEGEFYDVGKLERDLKSAVGHVEADNHAALLVAGLESEGTGWLRRVGGSFAGAVWDSEQRTLRLISDRFGTRPVYYTQQDGCFRFSSSLRSLTQGETVGSPSHRGVAQFFTFGQYLQYDTSVEGVRVLPAGSVATYDTKTGDLRIENYWHVGEVRDSAPRSADQWLEEADSRFGEAMRRTTGGDHQLGLALSGGLDARTLLGGLGSDPNVKTICYGMDGSRDHELSRQMASLARCPHENHVLDEGFLANFERHLQEMTVLTDGQYLSQCIVMPTLPLYRRLGIEVLLRGHAGELMHMSKAYSYSVDRQALAIQDDAGLEQWLFSHLQAYMLDGVRKPLFSPEYQGGLRTLALESLREALAEINGVDSPTQRIWRLFVHQRLRRETVLSLVKFRSVVEVRLPYLDNDLVELLLDMPPDLKLDDCLQGYILRQRKPEFLEVRNVNTGARIGAGKLQRTFESLKMKVLAKLGVRGYQPYERLGLWLRREVAPVVKHVLLSDRCLERGVFDPDGVRDVVQRHLTGQANHTFLIMAMMVFETGQRYLGEPRRDTQHLPEAVTGTKGVEK